VANDYKVKDIARPNGAARNRHGEQEMPRLMALRKEFAGKYPLKGAKIAGLLQHDD